MNSFDDELRSALRREEPAPNFTERLLSRVTTRPHTKFSWRHALWFFFQPRKLRWVTVTAVACVLLVAGALQYRRHRRMVAEGEIARERVILALQIASTKLNVALQEVQRLDQRQPAGPVKAK